jgi:chemotaxis signal transduction protein
MQCPPAETKAVLFVVGGVRLALRLSQVREIVAITEPLGELSSRGDSVPALPVAVALNLPASPSRFALVIECSPVVALGVEAVHGIVDLADAEVFQLPARTLLPQPPPFCGAIVAGGVVALELVVSALGWAPLEPAGELAGPPPGVDFPTGRELLFSRAGRTYAVPIEILDRVCDAPRIFPVPLTPTSHRGLLYLDRAVHPVFDLALLHGDAAAAGQATALLLEAGGEAIAVLADRILPAGDPATAGVTRPSWDAMFAAL